MTATLASRTAALRAQIDAAAIAAGRAPGSVTLLAVAKTRTADEVREAIAAGIGDIGENYVDEALAKIAAIRDAGLTCRWHFVGHLQSNKSAKVAAHFDWVHTVDSERIARRLDAQRPASLPPLQVTLQVNFARQDSKAGIAREDELVALALTVADLPRLRLRGLMTIPDPAEDPRQAFARVRAAADTMRAAVAERAGAEAAAAIDSLSMGMSDDFPAAIAEGATMVRIGTALFGPRPAARPRTHEEHST